jgi:ABC-type antimicrobial peptide transport system permease subunit
MTYRILIAASLRFHARAHLGVLLGAAIGSAALTGALIVGDSVRESLQERALQRLANTYYALESPDRFFNRWPAPYQLSWFPAEPYRGTGVADILALHGVASNPSAGTRANEVHIVGVDTAFWMLAGVTNIGGRPVLTYDSRLKDIVWRDPLAAGSVFLNTALAHQLGVSQGDEVLLRVNKPDLLSLEAAVAQRRSQTPALRLKVAAVLAANQGGNLELKGGAAPAMNAFVSYDELEVKADLAGKANLRLFGRIDKRAVSDPQGLGKYVLEFRNWLSHAVSHGSHEPAWRAMPTREAIQLLTTMLHERFTDADVEWKDIPGTDQRELRTRRIFLDPPIVAAATKMETNSIPILTYLASLISAGSNTTPYSMVTAAGPPYTPADLRDDEVVVNQWLADDLNVKPGDPLVLNYFLPESGAALREATNHFHVRSIVPMDLPWADLSLMPGFPGIENASTPLDWDMDFPRMNTIRPKDEAYWKQWRGTPKAFVTLRAGQKMWANRFGNLTAIRFPRHTVLEVTLLSTLKPEDFGVRFETVREQALKAAEQSQDFGQLFLGFSIFLVVAALLLMALLFGFGLEQRAPEIGALLALGFLPKQVRRLLLMEGVALAFVGSVLGALAGLGYARAMLWALTTIWRKAVGSSQLTFHATPLSLFIGLFAGTMVAVFTIWLTLRRQARQPAIELLSGHALQDDVGTARSVWSARVFRRFLSSGFGVDRVGRQQKRESGGIRAHSKRFARFDSGLWIALLSLASALAIIATALAKGERSNAEVFFSAGALLLVAGLGLAATWLRALGKRSTSDRLTLSSFGVRGCARRRKRSVAVAALLASGCFVIAAISVFRLDANRDAWRRTSGTGGFALFGDSTMPIVQDLNAKTGQEFFGLNPQDLAGVQVVPFRVHEGDEASCLNLNRAQRPRLLGVKPDQLSGRFTFTGAEKGFDRAKGWDLLRDSQSKIQNPKPKIDEVPAIGDANSIEWAMGKKLGDTIDYTDEYGRPFKVRLVGAVANSILQGNLIVDEAEFLKRFPSQSGHRMFLIDAPSNQIAQVSSTLSRALQDMGLELTPAIDKLNAFNAVQNTYLGTFQILGGLGLLLGSAGLGIIVLRDVLERRGELGLLLAVGFRRRALEKLVLAEHGALLVTGIAIGIISAAAAVLPALLSPGAPLPYLSLVITLSAVCLNGILWTWLATRYALRGDLLEALRNE